jgi:glycosyltransferase involved in cell wall biosynthesis
MHVVDALRVGGAERVAVNLANLMPTASHQMFLCTTREEGPFAELIRPHVGRLALFRKGGFDLSALRRMLAFIRKNEIQILHAHGSALFFARIAAFFPPYPAIVWHDHYGRYLFNDRNVFLYQTATARIGGVIAVNQPLADWSRESLKIPSERVWYIPNLVEIASTEEIAVGLPGKAGKRIVCVANIRPQKDHSTLLKAMTLVKAQEPDAHLLLVGDFADEAYKNQIVQEIGTLSLDDTVTYLGRRGDITSILKTCDIAVLSSLSEGLPISLLEYGAARLPAISTDVGQCAEVLGHGSAGVLVPPAKPEDLAAAILALLGSETERHRLGEELFKRVAAQYSAETAVEHVAKVYQQVLSKKYGLADTALRASQTSRCTL